MQINAVPQCMLTHAHTYTYTHTPLQSAKPPFIELQLAFIYEYVVKKNQFWLKGVIIKTPTMRRPKFARANLRGVIRANKDTRRF